MLRTVVAVALLLLLPSLASAQKRVALIIGNSAYKHTSPLDNPRNDAADMVVVLRSFGFQVISGFDLHKAAFDSKIHEFAIALSNSDAGVFFFAGPRLASGGTELFDAHGREADQCGGA